MKKTLTIIGFLAVFTAGAALADDDCFVPMADWQPRDAVARLAEENGWAQDKIDNLKWTEKKVDKKFEKPFFGKPAAPNAAVMEEESTPEVSVSARDPEDDKWTSFPDISFPSSK